MIKRNYFGLFVVFFYFISCKSPTDFAEPKEDNTKHNKIILNLKQYEVKENDSLKVFFVSHSKIELDTSYNPPRVWLNLLFELKNKDSLNLNNRIAVSFLEIKLDSVPVNGNNFRFNDSNSSARAKLIRGDNIFTDTTVEITKTPNKSEISFTLDNLNKTLNATCTSTINNYFIRKEFRDSIVYDTLTYTRNDSIIHEIKQRVISIEKLKYTMDSSLINSKIKFSY